MDRLPVPTRSAAASLTAEPLGPLPCPPTLIPAQRSGGGGHVGEIGSSLTIAGMATEATTTPAAGHPRSDAALDLAAGFPAATREQWLALVDGVLKGVPFEKMLRRRATTE